MKKYLFLALSVSLSVQLIAQIRCVDLKCITEEEMRYEADDFGNEIIKVEDISNPVYLVVFDSLGYESEVTTYPLIPFTGCLKMCDDINLNEINYYENGKRQGPSYSYGSDGDVISKGHYFNNNRIGEHVRYNKNREIISVENYDQFGKRHGEEIRVQPDSIMTNVFEHGKLVSSSTKKVKKK